MKKEFPLEIQYNDFKAIALQRKKERKKERERERERERESERESKQKNIWLLHEWNISIDSYLWFDVDRH